MGPWAERSRGKRVSRAKSEADRREKECVLSRPSYDPSDSESPE